MPGSLYLLECEVSILFYYCYSFFLVVAVVVVEVLVAAVVVGVVVVAVEVLSPTRRLCFRSVSMLAGLCKNDLSYYHETCWEGVARLDSSALAEACSL